MNRQEILEALKNDNYYRNLSDKDFFDANNLDNLAKYLEHNFAKTDESKKVILDMLSHKKHNPNDLYNYRITQEELFNLNKKYYDNTYLYHGLNAYTTNLTDKSLDISEKIENNLHNIINNKDIELATSSTHMIGDIGIKGKGDSLFAQPWDMYSVVDKETGKRNKPRERTIITEDDIFDIIEKYHDNPKSIKPWKKHDEVIAKNFEIDSLWVKEDFYNNNQDFVLKLLKDNKIQNLDIIHSNSFEQYRDVDIERVNVNNINLKNNKAITPSNLEKGSTQFIEPPTWDEITASKEYKEYRKTFDFFLDKNEKEIRAFFDDPSKYNDQRMDMLEKAKKLKEKVWEPYKKNAEKIGYKYDNDLTSIDLSKIVTNDDIIDTFDDNIIFSGSSEAKAIIAAPKSKSGITQKEIETLFNSSIKDNTVFNVLNGDLNKQLGDLKYDYHLNPKISRKFVNNESRNAFHELYKNADKLSPSQISEKINDVLKYNAKTLDTNITYNHGLIAYGFGEKDINKASQNLQNIIDNPKIQVSATEEAYRLGEMGISGKGIPKMYYESDLYTKPTINGERITNFKTVEDFMKSNSLYSEYVVENFQPEKLWAKEDFYKSHTDEITDIAKRFNINEIDLIKGNKGGADLFSGATYVSETIQVAKTNPAEISQQNLNKLSLQEAFDKYGPDNDMFYISQGLNPKEQRKITNELNSKRKPKLSDKETLNKLHNDTKEAANQFYKTTEEANQIIEEYNQLKIEENKPKPEKPIQKPSKPKQEVKKPESKIPENIDFSNILEDTAKETAKQNNKLTNKTVKDTAKKALNTKKLGIGLAIGATVLLAGAAGAAAHKKDEKKKEKEKEKREQSQNTNTNNNEIDYSQDLQYARQITNFSRGHSTYRLRG